MLKTISKYLVSKGIIFLLILSLFPGRVFGQQQKEKEPITYEKPDICGEIVFDPTAGEYPITLEESLSIVLDKNFDVKIFTERKNRSKWLFYESVTDWLPDVLFEHELFRVAGTVLVGDILPISISETPIEVNFILDYDINIRKYFQLKETLYDFNSQKKELEFTKDEVILETVRNYYELLRAKLNIDILEVNKEQIEEQLRINQSKLEAGVGTKFDVLRAEADLATADQQLILAKNTYRLEQAQLANTLGIPVLFQLVPNNKDVFIKEIFEDCFTIEHAKMIALVNRPDLAAQQFNVEAARQRKYAGYAPYIPELKIFGRLAEQGTSRLGLFPSRLLGFRVNWNGFDNLGFKGFTQIKARNARLREEQFEYINRARNIEENLVSAYFSTIAARELVESTERELRSAKESRRLSVIRLEAGVGTFIDVLQAQSTYTTARINNLRAIVEYNISQSELLFEMGVISANNVLGGFKSGTYKPNRNIQRSREYNKKIKEELKEAEQDEFKRTQPETNRDKPKESKPESKTKTR